MTAPTPTSTQLALLLRVGEARMLVPLSRVERIYPMVQLPPGPPRVQLRGEILPVIDPRAAWNQPPVLPAPPHRLVVLQAPTREAWWVDEAGPILPVPGDGPAVLDGQVVTVLW